MSISIIEYPSGGSGTITGASNGLSLSSNVTQLGQSIGAVGDPASLLSNREIPMSTFTITQKDSTGQSSVFGAGTLTITKLGGSALTINDTKTSNSNVFSIFSTSTSTLGGAFLSDSTFGSPFLGVKRFNTSSSGVTLNPSSSNRLGVIQATLQFENDVAVNNNSITIAGAQPVSVYSSKIDLWPIAGNQIKAITGNLCHYSTFLDASGVGTSSVQTVVDYLAGFFSGNASFPLTITNRYGFRVLDLNLGSQTTTNRWAFAQEGTTDTNWFAGFSGFGLNNASSRVHIAAGTATAGTAPIKLTAGVNLTIPENGTIEFDGTNLYFTVGGVRKTFTLV